MIDSKRTGQKRKRERDDDKDQKKGSSGGDDNDDDKKDKESSESSSERSKNLQDVFIDDISRREAETHLRESCSGDYIA